MTRRNDNRSASPKPLATPSQAEAMQEGRCQATFDALRPLSIGLMFLWILFIPIHRFDLPVESRTPMALHDLFMVALSVVLYLALRQGKVPVRKSCSVAGLLAIAISSNVLFAYWLTGGGFYSPEGQRCHAYIALILIAAGNLILVTRCFLLASTIILSAWALVAAHLAPEGLEGNGLFLQVAAVLVAVTIHFARCRISDRVSAFRKLDRDREAKLQALLAQTETARRDLDRRVVERTRELQGAYDNLTLQVEEGVRLDAKRTALEDELHHAQRMESVGQLAGGVAHDFNNLLTVIGGNVDLVLGSASALGDMDRSSLEDARNATNRATELTKGLLAYSRKQPVVFAALDPRKTLEGMRSLIEQAASENIEVDLALGQVDCNVLAGKGQIEQIVMNLVLNACDAMQGGGMLRVALDQVDELPRSLAGSGPGGLFVRLQVADTGCGMDESTKERVFEPFFTTKEVGKGTGLGLSVVHGIVSQHQGHLTVDSIPALGTTFSVYFPAVPRENLATLEEPGRLSDRAFMGETVLIVEDEKPVRRYSIKVFERLGFQVLAAESGAEALRVARDFEGDIHLLFTDVRMPGMTGPELAKQMRSSRPTTRVLLVSGYTDPKTMNTLDLRGGTAFLHKPFTIAGLREKIGDLLALGLESSDEERLRVRPV